MCYNIYIDYIALQNRNCIGGVSIMINYKQLAERLKKCRLDINYTQKELSKISGVSQPHISHIENGDSSQLPEIKLSTLDALAQALNISVIELLYDNDTYDKALYDKDEKVYNAFYPDKYKHFNVTSLLQMLIYLPIVEYTALYYALYGRFDLRNLKNKDEWLESFIDVDSMISQLNYCGLKIRNKEAKKYADAVYDLLDERKNKHDPNIKLDWEKVSQESFEEYKKEINNKLVALKNDAQKIAYGII